MDDGIPLEYLYESDSAEQAESIRSAIGRRARDEDDVRVTDEWTGSDESLAFRWKKLPRVEIQSFDRNECVDRPTVPDLPHVELEYDPDPFSESVESGDDTTLADAAVDLVDLVGYAYAAGSKCPQFVYGTSNAHRDCLANGDLPPPVTTESLAEDRIEYACWLMTFPPRMVETYGRETLLSAPAWQTTELSDGGVLVLTTQNPASRSKPEARAVDQHLGLDPPTATEDHPY